MEERKKYDDTYSYEILEDGYQIYSINHMEGDSPYVVQRDPYGKVFLPDGTYEENCLKQLKQMTAPPAPPQPSQEELMRGDIDYIALMEDLDLPSYETESEE